MKKGEDIRDEVEAALRESEDKLERILANSSELIGEIDDAGNYTFVNDRFESILGFTASELVGSSAALLLHPDDLEPAMSRFAALKASRSVSVDEWRIKDRHGVYRCFECRSGVYDAKGGSQRTVVVAHDISERLKAEAALRRSEEIFDRFMEHSPIFVFFKDESARTIRLSANYEKMLGRPLGELVGKRMDELFPAELAASMTADDLRVLREGKEAVVEEELGDRVYSTIKFPIEIFGGPRYLAGFTIDITERRLAEMKVKDLLAEKEIILKEVHHRVKNNLSTIYSLLSLQAGSMDEPAAAALRDAGGRVQSMMELYDKLYQGTSFSSLSARNYLPHLIDAIVANFPNRDAVRVEKRIDDVLLDAKVLQPLGIIVNELLTNAMKYAYEGRAEGLLAVTFVHEGGRARLTVRDDGAGMPEGFDFSGKAGFGLMLVAALARQLDGKLSMEREGGTAISLEFGL